MTRSHQKSRLIPRGPCAWVWLSAWLWLPLAVSYASTPGSAADELVWPAPPAEPRVAYVQSIAGPADAGVRPSRWGRFVRLLTGADKGAEGLVKPMGIGVDDAGILSVTDTGAGAVCLFDRPHARYLRWLSIGQIKLVSPVAVVSKDGTFFVADSALQKVLAFDGNGMLLFELPGLERPSGLAIQGEKLFVVDAQVHGVAVFDLRGTLLYRFGKRGAGPGEFNYPTHIAADAKGRLFVSDTLNDRVQILDAEGRFQGLIGSAGDGSGHFSRPKGVALDTFGHVYVVDSLHDNVQVFDQEGHFLLHWGQAGSGPGEFWLPTGIAISRNNDILVADSYNRRVQVFKYVGKQ